MHALGYYVESMKISVQIDNRLLARAKKKAATMGTNLNAFIERSLRQTLARKSPRGSRKRLSFPTSGGGGLQPGVNLDNSAALLDLMDGIDSDG